MDIDKTDNKLQAYEKSNTIPIAHPVNLNPYFHERTYVVLTISFFCMQYPSSETNSPPRLVTLWTMTYGVLVTNVKAAPPNFRSFMLIQGLAISIWTNSKTRSHQKTNTYVSMYISK